MKKTKVFLGAYINSTNAQNLNCFALAKYLDKEKFEVYTLEVYSGNLINKPICGVKVFRCFYPFKFSKYLGFLWGIWNADIAYLPKRELIGWNRLLVKLLQKKSFKTVENIFDEYMIKSASSYFGSYQKLLDSYQNFDKCFSITGFMNKYNLIYHGIMCEEKILYLGTDIDVFLNENKKIDRLTNVIIVGSDLVRKGIADYLELSKSFSEIIFHIVGSGHGMIDIESIVQKNNLENIRYHGTLGHEELDILMKKIDLHIFPSRSEGFPKVLLETAAAGIPSLIYSDYGANEWTTNYKDGFVVNTLDEMKEIIVELLNNPQLLQDASKKAIEMAKRFDWKVLVKEWENEILTLAKGK